MQILPTYVYRTSNTLAGPDGIGQVDKIAHAQFDLHAHMHNDLAKFQQAVIDQLCDSLPNQQTVRSRMDESTDSIVDPSRVDSVALNIDNVSPTTSAATTGVSQPVLPAVAVPLQPVYHEVLIPHDQLEGLAPHRFLFFSILVGTICGLVNLFTLCCSVLAIIYSFLVSLSHKYSSYACGVAALNFTTWQAVRLTVGCQAITLLKLTMASPMTGAEWSGLVLETWGGGDIVGLIAMIDYLLLSILYSYLLLNLSIVQTDTCKQNWGGYS